MPVIIDYSIVRQTLQAAGLECLYHNSGSWGYPPPAHSTSPSPSPLLGKEIFTLGLLLADDPTLRQQARPMAKLIDKPVPASLAYHVLGALAGLSQPLWLMPGSHWAYELTFGTPPMTDWLEQAGLTDAQQLTARNDGSAVAFSPAEFSKLAGVLSQFWSFRTDSDYRLYAPNGQAIVHVHHHRQAWVLTPNEGIIKILSNGLRPLV